MKPYNYLSDCLAHHPNRHLTQGWHDSHAVLYRRWDRTTQAIYTMKNYYGIKPMWRRKWSDLFFTQYSFWLDLATKRCYTNYFKTTATLH